MTRTRYRQLLRDPRWQRRRLEVLQRDHWRCRDCGAEHRELHVHHTVYVAGQAPWEAPTRDLVTLCVDCHKARHRQQRARVTGARRRLKTKVQRR